MKKEKLIAIVGATATGKSKLAIILAEQLNGEIISADSAQVYIGMDIGTAKISDKEQHGIPHHLLDIVDPLTDYNVGCFQSDAKKTVTEITAKGKMPILCGGSGLYINSLINFGYDLPVIPGNPRQREALLTEEKVRGEGYLYRCLTEKYPLRAKKIHPHDFQRILRALEMKEDAAENDENNQWDSPYDLSIYGLTAERSVLYERIENRVDIMFEQGLIEEVRGLLSIGCREKGNALSALGYKEIIPYLQGTYDITTAKELLKKNTRHFAKRQQTWFKRDPRILWFDICNDGSIEDIAAKIICLEKKGLPN